MSITLPGFRAPMSRPERPSLLSPAVLRTEVLAGLVVGLALIPEAIAFSVIAGVDPRVGLFSSVTMAITIAFAGGRPAMVSAARAISSSVRTMVRVDRRSLSSGATISSGLASTWAISFVNASAVSVAALTARARSWRVKVDSIRVSCVRIASASGFLVCAGAGASSCAR